MELVPVPQAALTIGQLANEYAASNVFQEYQQKMAANTLKRHNDDIALFSQFLKHAGMSKDNLMSDCAEWQDITFGLVEAFKRWQLDQGYAIASINAHISTVKVYARLAVKAGTVSAENYALIKMVSGYRHKEGRNVDEKREVTRVGTKKAEAVSISPEQAKALKEQSEVPQGRRDAFLMCLLLDHGLRVGEIADLNTGSINLQSGELTIYRHKTNKTQVHYLTPDTYTAARAYLAECDPAQGSLFVGICSKTRVNTRSINERVAQLGESIGVKGLSPHDCRHYYATDALRNGTDIKSLQDAGGWNSPAMPLRYAESAKVANSGVKLSAYKKDA